MLRHITESMSSLTKFTTFMLLIIAVGDVGFLIYNYIRPKDKLAVVDISQIVDKQRLKFVKKYEANMAGNDDEAIAQIKKEMEKFSIQLAEVLEKESAKRPIFVKQAVIDGTSVVDITDELEEKLK